mmetsp:Transcript_37718/g.96501  ORF Transcript_37718/g.96501 Transcript_37718/m.96501 type:complete len:214 (+) Transcript_37718:485-1126(+)
MRPAAVRFGLPDGGPDGESAGAGFHLATPPAGGHARSGGPAAGDHPCHAQALWGAPGGRDIGGAAARDSRLAEQRAVEARRPCSHTELQGGSCCHLLARLGRQLPRNKEDGQRWAHKPHGADPGRVARELWRGAGDSAHRQLQSPAQQSAADISGGAVLCGGERGPSRCAVRPRGTRSEAAAVRSLQRHAEGSADGGGSVAGRRGGGSAAEGR